MKREKIKELIGKLKEEHNDKEIKLNKIYFTSEWSYDPLYEGYNVYCEKIVDVKEINGYKVYSAEKNNRYYFAWDIHESIREADEISNLKNLYLYDWCEYGEEELINEGGAE